MTTFLRCADVICEPINIPAASATLSVDNVIITVDIPAGFEVTIVSPSIGSAVGNVWTIPNLPANTGASASACFKQANCAVAPTGVSGNITIASDATETNTNNNTVPYTLDYISCSDVRECVTLNTSASYDFLVGDFPAAVGQAHILTVPQISHGVDSPKNVTLYRTVAGGFEQTIANNLTILTNGDISFQVSESPDGRFDGYAYIN
jgi:hypothetical protein